MAKTVELRPGEEIWSQTKGDCWSVPVEGIQINGQTPGKFIFTNQRIIFQGGGLIEKLRMNFEIQLDEIESMKPYTISLLIPTGIRVYLKNGEQYKLSVLGRKKHLTKLEELTGVVPA